MTQKDTKFYWSKECETAFNSLKEQLSTSPVLGFPNFAKDFILYADASDIGIGAVLPQKDDEGNEHVISYSSKAFTGAEKRWTTTEKEAYAVVWALTHYHAYVYGHKVIVFTDHRPLQWLRALKNPNGKLARWILRLEEYDYSIVHKPGTAMQHADALSRAPLNSVKVLEMSKEEIAQDQEEDPDVRKVVEWVQNQQKPTVIDRNASSDIRILLNIFDSLVIKDRVLYRKWKTDKEEDVYQMVLPLNRRQEVMNQAHILVGHMGKAKTFALIQQGYYWPGFYKDIEEFCRNCDICARNKLVPRPRWPLCSIEVTPVPFYMVGVDIIGPLKTTRFGNRYILVLIDYFTKYVEALPMRNMETVTVVRCLEEIFSRHGMPSIMLTDQGANFQSALMRSVCNVFNIEQRRTTAYHPQTDGLCERVNKTLKALLRVRTNKDGNNWDEELPFALLAYRIAKQESTGMTPFELLYGRQPRLSFVDLSHEEPLRPIGSTVKYLDELKARQNRTRKAVIENIEKAQDKQKRNYDERFRAKRSSKFQIGDFVLLRNFRARGLDEKYKGPYQIIKLMNADCEVRSLENNKTKVVHYNNLKPYYMELEVESTVFSSDDNIESSSETEIEHYVSTRLGTPVQDVNEQEQQLEERRPYELRRQRRRPDRYGIPVYDF